MQILALGNRPELAVVFRKMIVEDMLIAKSRASGLGQRRGGQSENRQQQLSTAWR
jgi:hypothetical protein